jgi:hypothetical protein
MAVFAAEIGNFHDAPDENLTSEKLARDGGRPFMQIMLHAAIGSQSGCVQRFYRLHPLYLTQREALAAIFLFPRPPWLSSQNMHALPGDAT